MDRTAARAWRRLLDPRVIAGVWVPIVAISIVHYGTPSDHQWIHDVARRLYYLPIILGAFYAGSRGGLAAAVVASVAYLPHAFTHVGHMDPSLPLEKLLEVVLYLVVGLMGGVLVDRERAERVRQQELARRLQRTLDDLKQTERQLVRSGRLGALGQLTAGLAHEIKNPLHAMRGTAEIVRDAIETGRPERRMAELHLREIDRLAGVLERFLAFARPRTAAREEVDLVQVALRVCELASAQARKGDIDLRAPADRRPRVVLGDAEALVQVTLSIVLNGLDALAGWDGERRLHLSLIEERRGAGPFLGIEIVNTGPPIPEDDLERIFDPFVTTKDGGTGLGLSIAARIADDHGGFVEARNRDGGGVSFRLLLPRADAAGHRDVAAPGDGG